MKVTTRTLVWLGAGIGVLGLANAFVLVWFVAPSLAAVVLFLENAFFAVGGLSVALLALVQRRRDRERPGQILREGALLGLLAAALLTLQYLAILDAITAAATVLLFGLVELVFLYVHRSQEAAAEPEAPPRAPSDRSRSGSRPRKSTRPPSHAD